MTAGGRQRGWQGAGRHKVHSGRQDSDKKAVRVGDMDAGVHSNVKTFSKDDGKADRENGGMPGRMEAGQEE